MNQLYYFKFLLPHSHFLMVQKHVLLGSTNSSNYHMEPRKCSVTVSGRSLSP